MDQELKYWLGFNVFAGIGPVRFKLLLDYFGSVKDAWHAPIETLKNIKLGEKLADSFDQFRKTFDPNEYLEKLYALHVSVLTLDNPKYPKLLKEIPDPPFILYIKAKPHSEKLHLEKAISIVGTRKVTRYGEEVTRRLTTDLVMQGFVIVSGMAYGVDAIAHQAAIDSGGKTIAVLGCGIDIIAPPVNAALYHDIGENGYGAVVSEMPLGLRPTKGLFPARNRIISGLSIGVVVTEGADDSGALITARNALEQGREVFAVPGPITSPYSKGPAKLLKHGAKLVESIDDILEELDIQSTTNLVNGKGAVRLENLSPDEEKVMKLLVKDNMHIDEIIRISGLNTSRVTGTITLLELKGIIKDYGEKNYGYVNRYTVKNDRNMM